MSEVLDRFSPATRAWFGETFAAPTEAQLGAWLAISRGSHALVVAPTGSGKTLAAFLWAIDRLAAPAAPRPDARAPSTRVLYISPLKALGVDVERNLRAPLAGITRAAERLGLDPPHVTVGVRSGDTPAAERRRLVKAPPDILITTPESLFLMLTSAARESLRTVDTVIVDEIHAVAATKRGAHLALSLERLDALLLRPAQRIGLSATVRPREEVARFLGGVAPVAIVSPASRKRFELRVVVPVEDMGRPGSASPPDLPAPPGSDAPPSVSALAEQGSIWPHVEEAIVDRVLAHRSSIVFANSRRLAERLTARFNEIYAARLADAEAPAPGARARPPAELMGASGRSEGAEPLLARAHHGSVSKEQRASIEEDLKTGRLRCVVATSSLELGIDMGAVDLVVQVESPPSVASGLQRVGRAGHQVGEVSRGVIFPKHRADLVHAAVAAERMAAGLIESTRVPANPLDILAQQTVAAVALEPVGVEAWFDLVRRSAPFATLPRSAYLATLDLLAGRYPTDQFAELRPRIVWDRAAGTLTGRPGAQRLAVTNGGTIPDRGLFGVFMVGDRNTGRRVGELDEEMVYESRVGDVFALGTTSWRIQEITHDRVNVSPAFGEPGRLPFWKGDGLGRPAELGAAIGAFLRDVAEGPAEDARVRCAAAGLDERATSNLLGFLDDQLKATGRLPTDRTLVVERFRDELGDWRVVLHSPFGMPVHAPWALAVGARIRDQFGIDGGCVASDDGIVVRIPDSAGEPPGSELFVFGPEELELLVTDELGGSALFASRFRECAARALLLPRYRPGTRSPLWQQRQKAAQLLDVARDFPTFPIILETMRECLQDVYDLPALTALSRQIAARTVRLVDTMTEVASPFASALLFGYVAAFMYEGDSPLAERRAAALSIDSGLLAELLGRVELRELLDPAVIEQTEAQLQRLTDDRRARGREGLADLLRGLGPLTLAEAAARLVPDLGAAVIDELAALVDAGRALRCVFAGHEWWAAVEDAGRLRDALGVTLPAELPEAFTEPVPDALGDLVSRYARTHGPFTTAAVAERFGLGTAVVQPVLRRLADARRLVEGEFRPTGRGGEWCDTEVLHRLRRRSLAALRHEVEPVDPVTLGLFLPDWQHVGGRLRGVDGVASVIEQLEGARIPASAWESLVLPARVADYRPALLDELTASGDVLWAGAGPIAGSDGWVSLHLADTAPLTLPPPSALQTTPLQQEVLATLDGGGAYFFRQLSDAVGSRDDAELIAALWELAWAGLVTGDTFAPVRAILNGGRNSRPRSAPRARLYRGRGLSRAALGRPVLPSRNGPPSVAGRWSILPLADDSPTRRAHALGELLLERHGVVTRGAVTAESVPGGFALVYRTLSGFEESGRCRRGYFVDGLGAAQFATTATIDRLRSFADRAVGPAEGGAADRAPGGPGARPGLRGAVTLAATDPANPFGAALPWPSLPEGTTHRPGRKAGALVVIVDGALALYIERGGRSVLSFSDDNDTLAAAAASVAGIVLAGRIEKLSVETVNGAFVMGMPLGAALRSAGFGVTPRGLRLRA